jgi:hypothetical protein
MKICRFLVILLLILNLLAYDILLAPERTHIRTIISVESQDLPEVLQVSKEYLPASLCSGLVGFKSRPQIPSWRDRLLLEFPLRTHQPVGHFLLEVFLPPSTILNVVSTIILRC